MLAILDWIAYRSRIQSDEPGLVRDDLAHNPTEREVLLAEYSEIGEAYRHDDTMIYSGGALFVPVAFAALIAAWTGHASTEGLFFGSIAVFAFWFISVRRLAANTAVRHERAHEIERRLGMDHHKRLQVRDAEDKKARPYRHYLKRIKTAETAIFLLLAIAWLVTMQLQFWSDLRL